MFTISTIGSCRIATPARLSRMRYGYAVNGDRNYGFCHTSAEAVQQLKFMQGKLSLPENLWRMVARRRDRDTMLGQEHSPSDLYIVELASAKRVMHGDVCVQLNYLAEEFRDFFSDSSRVREFWSLCKKGDADEIDTFLSVHWSSTVEQKAESTILRDLRMTMTTEEEIRSDIRYIIDNTQNVFFVTHVDAVAQDGKTIPSRSKFIDLSTRAVLAEGGVVYNPTARMNEMGQNIAIEDYSDSLAHFTEDFCHLFFWDWYELGLQPAMDAKVRSAGECAVKEILVPNIKSMISADLTTGLSERLAALTNELGPLPDLIMMQSDLDVLENTPDKALERLSNLFNMDPLNAVVGAQLLQAAIDNARSGLVLSTLTSMLKNSFEVDAQPIFEFAYFLKSKGQLEDSASCLILGYRAAAELLTADQAALYCNVMISIRPDILKQLPKLDQDRLMELVAGPLRINLALLLQHDEMLQLCRDDLRLLSGDQLQDIAQGLSDGGERTLAVDMLATWLEVNGLDRLMHLGLRKLVDGWFDEILTQGVSRAELISSLAKLLRAHPLHRSARRELRSLHITLRDEIRAAYKGKNIETLRSLLADNAALPEPMVELNVFLARTLFEKREYPEVLTLTADVLKRAPDHILMWLLRMRSAYRLGDILVTYEAAQEICTLSTDDSQHMHEEAQSYIDRIPAAALRAVRNEEDLFVAYRLFSLAQKNVEYVERAEMRKARIENLIVKNVRTLEVDDPERQFENISAMALDLFPENERLLQSAGRYYVRRKDFKNALPFWERIVRLSPQNSTYKQQLERCYERTATSSQE